MSKKISKIVCIIVMAYAVSALLLCALALAALKLGFGESVILWGVLAVYLISTFAAGIMTGITIRRRRTVWGLAVGALYYFILLTVSIIMNKGIATDMGNIAAALAVCIAGGFVGGYVSGNVNI